MATLLQVLGMSYSSSLMAYENSNTQYGSSNPLLTPWAYPPRAQRRRYLLSPKKKQQQKTQTLFDPGTHAHHLRNRLLSTISHLGCLASHLRWMRRMFSEVAFGVVNRLCFFPGSGSCCGIRVLARLRGQEADDRNSGSNNFYIERKGESEGEMKQVFRERGNLERCLLQLRKRNTPRSRSWREITGDEERKSGNWEVTGNLRWSNFNGSRSQTAVWCMSGSEKAVLEMSFQDIC